MIIGCDQSRTSKPSSPQPSTASHELTSPQKGKSESAQAPETKSSDTKPSVPAVVAWELNPPKSVIAANTTATHDSGAVFMHYCSVCHGPQGRGDGQYYSDELPSRPADLTDQKAMELLSDDHLTQVIMGGSVAVGKSPLCPPWGRVFSKDQVAELVGHLRTLPALAAKATEDQKHADETADVPDDQK